MCLLTLLRNLAQVISLCMVLLALCVLRKKKRQLNCALISFIPYPVFPVFHQVMKEEWSSQTIAASCCSV